MIVDANVLLYAVDDQSHFHTAARTWLDDAMNGVERVGLPWVSLMAFQRIITHPRVTSTPLSRYSGLNATVSSVPSYAASSCSCAWPTSWVMATSSRPSALIASRTGVLSSRAISFTRLTASTSASRPTVSRFGWLAGMSPDIPESKVLDNPYTYTDYADDSTHSV